MAHPEPRPASLFPVGPLTKFFYAPGSCSLAPHILLHEAGIDFKGIRMRPGEARDAYPESFRQINPKMRVPVISVDDEIVSELPAVMTVISSLAPEKQLMGKTSMETVRVYEWLNWLSGTLHSRGFGHYHRPDRFSDDLTGLEGIRSSAKRTILECFQGVESKLHGVHAVGDHLTAVDPFLFVFYRWGNKQKIDRMSEYPLFTALVSNLARREAVATTLKSEQIGSCLE
ncbi:glutathione S-transferase [Aspergillus leporis]|uniref:Glutathione S-transferase n=1 Tax=Aspergillus leporis TaxID=41062 RepID=A0A5N5WM52_9EURO|nr:glutathione S-transferase [Aspergillus leporis]